MDDLPLEELRAELQRLREQVAERDLLPARQQQIIHDLQQRLAAAERAAKRQAAPFSQGPPKARAKLPVSLLRPLALQAGTTVQDQAPAAWRWHGRRVPLTDGCELSMPDTPGNQAAYPQLRDQEPGLGFPRLRLVVRLAFATVALVGCALGPCKGPKSGEPALLAELLDRVRAGDVLVADRYYCTWWPC